MEVARTLSNLGNAFGSLGDAVKQRELLERSLRIQEAYFVPDHFDLAIVLCNLGQSYRGEGVSIKIAKQFLGRAADLFERKYGAAHAYSQMAKPFYDECDRDVK